MRSSISEHGTPVKKSKPCTRRRAANSRPGITPAASPGGAAAAHDAQEVAERGEPHEGVLPLLVADGGLRTAVVVAGEEPRVVGQRAQALGERVVHLARVAAGQIGAAAR